MRKEHRIVDSTAPGAGLIDYDALARAIRVKMGDRKQDACAAEAGLSSSTFSRLVRNFTLAHSERQQVESETVFRVCVWLGVPLETFTDRGQPPQTGTLDSIEWFLLRDKRLKREDALKISDMLRAAYNTLARKEENHGVQS